MISKTEQEIMQTWAKNNGIDPEVSVSCATYNHEKYIANALDSFLSQVTDFPFEIVVHDDASTDKTAKIIREYEEKYPNIVRPIYEKENQYSKFDGSLERIITEKQRGKYIAICEGDDYWCDNKKLQKQYNYLTTHSECSLCCHNTVIHDINGNEAEKTFNDWKDVHILEDEEVFFGWNVHTSSYFYNAQLRKEAFNGTNEIGSRFRFGDFVVLTILRNKGNIVSLPDVMSVYNLNISNGASVRYYKSNKKTEMETLRQRIDYLNEYNKITNNKFKEVVDSRIAELTFQISMDKTELQHAALVLRKSKYYKKSLKNQKFSTKVRTYCKLYGSLLGDLWYRVIRMRRQS